VTQFYAGIGSRQTPAEIQRLMHDLAVTLAAQGWTLRSGGANGADQAFLSGAIGHHTTRRRCVETFLPWADYERDALRRLSFGSRSHVRLEQAEPWAMKIAAQFHPNWEACGQAARKLHARNTHQILGAERESEMSKLVICWTKDGQATGGTGQAMRVADAYGVEIRNLHDETTRRRAEAFVAGR